MNHVGGAATTCGAAVLAAIALTCCSNRDPPKIEDNLFPADYKAKVIAALTKTIGDITNLRQASISDPTLRPVRDAVRYVICVRFNPRNVNHDYLGLTERIGYFYAGELTQFLEADKTECAWANYRPFPELEKVCMADKCE